MTTQTNPQTEALILLFKTMPVQIQREFTTWFYDSAGDIAQEKSDFRTLSNQTLARAYGSDEPEYSDADLIETNPHYKAL